MTRIANYLSSRDGKWLLAVFAVALDLRLGMLAYAHPDPRDGRYDDSVWYDTTARHLANGDGYVFDPTVWVAADGSRIYPDEDALSPTALWPPGYPLTLAVVYAATGDSVLAGQLLNVLFGAATVALVFLIARRLFDLTAAVFAGLSLAVLPSHILFSSVLLSETYFGFLLALLLAITVYFVLDTPRRDQPTTNIGGPAIIFALGVLTAFAGYVRGEFLIYGGVLALLVLWRFGRSSPVPLAALAIGAAFVVVPWTVRNAVTMDELIVGTTGAGRVMYQGHNPETDGGPSLSPPRHRGQAAEARRDQDQGRAPRQARGGRARARRSRGRDALVEPEGPQGGILSGGGGRERYVAATSGRARPGTPVAARAPGWRSIPGFPPSGWWKIPACRG